jgi:signal transduction histidine kinase
MRFKMSLPILSLTAKLRICFCGALLLIVVLIKSIFGQVDLSGYTHLSKLILIKELKLLQGAIEWLPDGTVDLQLTPSDDLMDYSYYAHLLGPWLDGPGPQEITYRVVDNNGRILNAPDIGANLDRLIAPIDFSSPHRDQEFSYFEGSLKMMGLTRRLEDNGRTFYIQVASSERVLNLLRPVIAAQPLSVTSTIVTIIAVMLVVGLMIHILLKPLRDISAAAARITPGNLHQRLSTEGMPNEIRQLIDGFNTALTRLEDGFRVQQEFLASAAHELKTPLALMRGQIELEPDLACRDVLLKDVDLMARQVRQLLHLAELSELQNYRFEMLDPAPIIHDVAAFLDRQAQRYDVEILIVEPDVPVTLWADASALFILLKNLLENAVAHAPAGTMVTVGLNPAEIMVTDEGSGINPDHLELLFERFWRGPGRTQEGAGLGLSICKEIATAHGWTIRILPQAIGTSFCIAWPEVQAPVQQS